MFAGVAVETRQMQLLGLSLEVADCSSTLLTLSINPGKKIAVKRYQLAERRESST